MEQKSPISIDRPGLARIKLALFWAILGGLGVFAVFPYQLEILSPTQLEQLNQVSLPLPVLAGLSALQTGVLLFVLCWLGLFLGEKLELKSAIANALVNGTEMPKISRGYTLVVVITGMFGGLLVLGLDRAFKPFMPASRLEMDLGISLWKRFLASIYGGITEELLLRLFLMTLLVWLLARITRSKANIPTWIFWFGIISTAILFGLGHLPATESIWPLTAIVITRALVLNGVLGLVFGYLYWKAGLEYAMLAHFLADIMLHVIGGT
jgi:membrane protease YdiL (CAAX protease family)